MRIFVISLLGIIFVTLITSSIPHVIGDELDVVTTEDSKYEIYLHVLVRNAQGELIMLQKLYRVNQEITVLSIWIMK